MKLRAACLIGFVFACAVFAGACSFSDNAQHCDKDSMCPGGRCYEGFCIPARETTSSSAQTMSDGGTSSGGSAAKGGSGGKNGQTATGSSTKPGGSGGSGPAGGSGGKTAGGSGGSGTQGSTNNGGNMMPPAAGAAGDACSKEGEERDCLVDPAKKTLAETCNRGKQLCSDGAWGVCDGHPVPEAESCNGLDDDCNGEVDDLVETCYPDGQAGCIKGADGRWSCSGTCGTGTRSCREGKLSDCTGATAPVAEVCTAAAEVARNEDCDDKTDEGCGDCRSGETRACYSGRAGTMGVGKCVMGTQTCTGGAFGPCTGEVTEQPETCANPKADDDCNGTVDDVPMLNGRCVVANASGPCANGTLKCSGTMLACQSTVTPTTEVCNGRDDDCNGRADDTFNLRRDPLNCGTCNNRCGAGDACCAGACTSTQSNVNNCGACGTKCAASERCVAGACMPTGMPMAGMPAGGSGPIGGASGGAGAAGAAGGGGSGTACSPACAAGETCCNGSCVNLMSDVMQCGACGNACMGADMGCCGGKCTSLTTNQNCTRCGRDCSLLLADGGVTCTCTKDMNGTVGCHGPVLDLCL